VTTFVLIPGAGGAAWYWHRVVPLLTVAGHEAIAVDLPGEDPAAGLPEYASRVLRIVEQRDDVALVAQSLGAFTAPLVAARAPLHSLTIVNGMIPTPGETPGEWWTNTGSLDARAEAARRGGYSPEFDLVTYFLHDVPSEVIREGATHQRPEADAVFGSPCEFESWPSIPIRVLTGADDRFFPLEFQRRVALDRLGLEVDVLPGGHLIALARPEAVAGYLLGVIPSEP